MQSLSESSAYSDLIVNGVALIRKQRLFEVRRLSEERRYLKDKIFIVTSQTFDKKNFQLLSLFGLDTLVYYYHPFSWKLLFAFFLVTIKYHFFIYPKNC